MELEVVQKTQRDGKESVHCEVAIINPALNQRNALGSLGQAPHKAQRSHTSKLVAVDGKEASSASIELKTSIEPVTYSRRRQPFVMLSMETKASLSATP